MWRGELPLSRVFWEYTIGWGTIVNLIGAGAALIVFMKDGPLWLGLLLHFAAVPMNAVLVTSVWRAAERESRSKLANFARPASVIWFVVMFVI
jgi:hypothetical protein